MLLYSTGRFVWPSMSLWCTCLVLRSNSTRCHDQYGLDKHLLQLTIFTRVGAPLEVLIIFK